MFSIRLYYEFGRTQMFSKLYYYEFGQTGQTQTFENFELLDQIRSSK